MDVPEISVLELKALQDGKEDIFILDVRNPDEYAECNLKGHLIPLHELPSRLNELDPNNQIIVHCQAGGRSRRAAEYLIQNGFNNVFNLRGGMIAWNNEFAR